MNGFFFTSRLTSSRMNKLKTGWQLFFLALLVSVVLLGAESFQHKIRLIYNPSLDNNLKLTDSAAQAIRKGQIVPRTLEGLSDDAGQAYHQFFSPGAHVFTALFVLLTSDLYLSHALAMLFFSMTGFIYSFKMASYLTRSNIAALVGSFIFVTSPYLASERVLRGAVPEYMAMCLLPMVLYFQIRALASGKWAAVVKAILALAFLFLLCLNTGVMFCFFFLSFMLLYLFYNIIYNRQRKIFAKKFFKRLFILAIIYLITLLLDVYYLYLNVNYHDLMINIRQAGSPLLSNSGQRAAFFTLFSIREMVWPTEFFRSPFRFQTGFMVLVGFCGFIYLKFRDFRSPFVWPIILTACWIMYLILCPEIFGGPLNFLDFIPYSVLFLSQYEVLGMLMGAMALSAFWRKNSDFTPSLRKISALGLILGSLILVSPYLYPVTFLESYPMFVKENQVNAVKTLAAGNSSYLRIPPNLLDNSVVLPPFKPEESLKAAKIFNSADRLFDIDLENKSPSLGGPGELHLDVLYYPGLMHIEAEVSGRRIDPIISTYWRSRDLFGNFGEKGGFHGLKLSDLPDAGHLTVRVQFVGNQPANMVSLMTLVGLLGFVLLKIVRRRKNSNV